MAENSRKNEFFERESIAIIAITTKSSIRVNGAGRERETFLEKGSPFLPRTPSILSKNFRVITFFASAKTVIVFFAKSHKICAVTTNSSIRVKFLFFMFFYLSFI